MDNRKEGSVLNKNWLWLLLISILLLLAIVIIYVYTPDVEGTQSGGASTTGEDGTTTVSPPNPPEPGSFNIIDPSPVFKDSIFTFSLIKDFPDYKKSYFIDGNVVCINQKTCMTKINTLGKHTLKICFDDLSLCDTVNVRVLNRVEKPIIGIENGPSVPNIVNPPKVSGTIQTYYKDRDNDELGDPKELIKSEIKPPEYVANNTDACPLRKGPESNNGCPEVKLKGNKSFLIGNRTTLSIDYNESRPNDDITWNGENNLYLSAKLGKVIEVSSDIVGKYRISYIIKNTTDNFTNSGSVILDIKITESKLGSEFMNLAEYGNNKLLNIQGLETKMKKSEDLLNKCIQGNIFLTKATNAGGTSSLSFEKLKDELLAVKRSSQTHINKIIISDIIYDDNSGKIKSFKYKLN